MPAPTEHDRKQSGRSPNPGVRISEGGYHHLLAAVYDLALAPADWPIVLRLLAAALNSPHASSVVTTPERDAPRPLGVVGMTIDEHCAFLRAWHKRNVFGTRRPVREAGAIVLGRSILPKPALIRTAMYRHSLGPRGIQEVARLDILAESYRSQSIALARPWSSGPFTSDELAFARALMPHLQRVARLHAHIEDTTADARTAMDALDEAQTALLLLDANGRVVHASVEADRLLCEADGLSAGRDGLRAATPALSTHLRALLARAAASSSTPGASGALHLRRPSGKPDLVLVAIPARSRSFGPDLGRATVILQITDPLGCPAPDPAILAAAFDLTPSEARLAADLLSGLSVGEAAAKRGRSIATMRTHLASVLAKTGTARQSDLVRLLSRLPRTKQRPADREKSAPISFI
jgi:DNA-binding CsgD family transcriptional regulator